MKIYYKYDNLVKCITDKLSKFIYNLINFIYFILSIDKDVITLFLMNHVKIINFKIQ